MMQYPASYSLTAPPPPGPTPAQPTIVIQPTTYIPPAPPWVTSKSINRQAVLLGTAQIILGILCIVFNVCGYFMYRAEAAIASSGVWAGLFFIVTGPFGIVAGKRHTRGWYITFMVLSIISAIFTISIIVQTTFGLASHRYAKYDFICLPNDSTQSTTTMPRNRLGCYWGIVDYPDYRKRTYFHASLLVCGLLEAIAAIWSSILCCRAVCCGQTSRSSQPGHVIRYPAGGEIVTIQGQPIIQGQPGFTYTMPMAQQIMPQQQQVAPVASPVHVSAYSSQQGMRTPPPAYQEKPPPMGI